MRYYFYRTGGCGVCGKIDGHWHDVDPKPFDSFSYEPVPLVPLTWAEYCRDNQGLPPMLKDIAKTDTELGSLARDFLAREPIKEPTPGANPPGPFVTSAWQENVGDTQGLPPPEPPYTNTEPFTVEPSPIFQRGTSHVVWPALYAYMKKRVERGLEKYGQELSTHDGRDGLHDALDEAVDLCFYLMKVVLEEQEKRIHEYEGLRGGVESGY